MTITRLQLDCSIARVVLFAFLMVLLLIAVTYCMDRSAIPKTKSNDEIEFLEVEAHETDAANWSAVFECTSSRPPYANNAIRDVSLERILAASSKIHSSSLNETFVAQPVLARGSTASPNISQSFRSDTNGCLSVDVLFMRFEKNTVLELLSSRRQWDRERFGTHTHDPMPLPTLVFPNLGNEKHGVVDFHVEDSGRTHFAFGSVRDRTKIFYCSASTLTSAWDRKGFVLADYPQRFSPDVSLTLDANGNVHVFWVWSVGSEFACLMHGRFSATDPSRVSFTTLARCDNLSYRVLAMKNGDLVLICKALNLNYGGLSNLGFRIGSDMSTNLRLFHDGTWSRWTRLSETNAGHHVNQTRAPFYPDVVNCVAYETGSQSVCYYSICDHSVLTVKYQYPGR